VRTAAPDLVVWWALLGFFAVMSLGPSLQIAGRVLPIPLPYRLLEVLVPGVQMSGVPVRMVVMVTLAAGILAGAGIDDLLRRGGGVGLAALLLVVWMGVEFLPRGIPTTDARRVPDWVPALAASPKEHGFFDGREALPDASALWFQTLHEVPMFEGFVARLPASVLLADAALSKLRTQGDFETLCREHGFAYFLLPTGAAPPAIPVEPVWRGEGLALYDVRAAWPCRSLAP
jgi:hypothetical protein